MDTQQGCLKAVVFDVDGTLIDSVDIHAQAWFDAFAEFGREAQFADRRILGRPFDAIVGRKFVAVAVAVVFAIRLVVLVVVR